MEDNAVSMAVEMGEMYSASDLLNQKLWNQGRGKIEHIGKAMKAGKTGTEKKEWVV